MDGPPKLTDRATLALRRARAAPQFAEFLHKVAADEINERQIEVNRTFTRIAVVTGAPHFWQAAFPDATLVADTETLDLAPGTYDLVIHAMCLHWANDPLGQIIQCHRALVPDGLFLAASLGGGTLSELRTALTEAEVALSGGLSPRVLPMAEIRDMGALLQRAGLNLPVADALPLRVTYADLASLVRDLRAMGETNAMTQRARRTPRALFAQAEDVYAKHFAEAGRLVATFEMIFLTGWAPHESQQKPMRPGSAKSRLADALNVPEHPLTPRGKDTND